MKSKRPMISLAIMFIIFQTGVTTAFVWQYNDAKKLREENKNLKHRNEVWQKEYQKIFNEMVGTYSPEDLNGIRSVGDTGGVGGFSEKEGFTNEAKDTLKSISKDPE